MPDREPELVPFLSSNDVKLLISENENIDDLLEFVLENYPKHELSTCVDVTIDIISQQNGDELLLGDNRIYHIRNGKKIEVMPIGIKGK